MFFEHGTHGIDENFRFFSAFRVRKKKLSVSFASLRYINVSYFPMVSGSATNLDELPIWQTASCSSLGDAFYSLYACPFLIEIIEIIEISLTLHQPTSCSD